jgi:hypothetical protein
MASAEDSFLSCSIGGANFRLQKYSVKRAAVVEENRGRVRWRVTVTGEGEAFGVDQASFTAAVAAASAAFSSSGQNLIIRGFNGSAMVSLLAASCVNKGPHFDFELGEHPAPFRQMVKFTANADSISGQVDGGGGGETPDAPPGTEESYEQTVKVDVLGLRTVTRKGRVTGPNAQNVFTASTLADARAAFPLPLWVVTHEMSASSSAQGLELTFTINAQEMAGPLPATGDGAVYAVKGSATVRVERDDQMRRQSTYDFDLQVKGDPMALVDRLRELGPAARPVVRESVTLTTIEEPRLRASFTVLEGGDGSILLNFSQRVEVMQGEDVTYEPKLFSGCEPLLLQKPKGIVQIVQSGSATGAGAYPAVPEPLLDVHLAAPRITYEEISAFEKRVSWTYTLYAEAQQWADLVPVLPEKIGRPQLAYSGSGTYGGGA